MSQSQGPERDAELLDRASSDPDAFAEFYRRHVTAVTRYLARRCATPEDVADAVSATFLAVLTSSGTYDESRGAPTAWLYSIAANAAKGQWKSSARDQRLFERVRGSRLLDQEDQERIAEMIDVERSSASLLTAVNAAPEGERRLVATMANRGIGPTEAARELGITPGAARTRLTRLRHRLDDLDLPTTTDSHTTDREDTPKP
jgi:RNA polymerase sigma-70 factor (ECF subfamily)